MNYTECKMPDLSDCSAVRLQGWSLLHACFLGDAGVTSKGRLYRRNFARLIDKSVYEYQMARKAVLDEIAERQRPYEQMAVEGRPLHILRFTDHFENCLNSVNRALKLFEFLRKEDILADFPQEVLAIVEADSRSLVKVRNAFEHIDGEIRKDKIAEGQPVMLCIGVDGERAEIGAYSVTFADVSETIKKLQGIGKLLFDSERVNSALAVKPSVTEESA